MATAILAAAEVPAQVRRGDRRRTKGTEDARLIEGLAVVSTELVPSNLPGNPPTGVTILTLEDGHHVYGCRDCEEIGPKRGDMMKHRAIVHGAGSFGSTTANRAKSAERRAAANAAAENEYVRVPKAAGHLTFAEIAEMAAQAEHWSSVVRGLNDTVDQLRRKLASVTSKLKHTERRLDKYEEMKARALLAEGQLAVMETAIERLGYIRKESNE